MFKREQRTEQNRIRQHIYIFMIMSQVLDSGGWSKDKQEFDFNFQT